MWQYAVAEPFVQLSFLVLCFGEVAVYSNSRYLIHVLRPQRPLIDKWLDDFETLLLLSVRE